MIEIVLEERFYLRSTAILRNIDEMRALVSDLPITPEEIMTAESVNPQAEHLYVCFLGDVPPRVVVDSVAEKHTGPDIVRAGKRELYLLCHHSLSKSRLAAHILKSQPSATMRNWRTVKGLFGLLSVQ